MTGAGVRVVVRESAGRYVLLSSVTRGEGVSSTRQKQHRVGGARVASRRAIHRVVACYTRERGGLACAVLPFQPKPVLRGTGGRTSLHPGSQSAAQHRIDPTPDGAERLVVTQIARAAFESQRLR